MATVESPYGPVDVSGSGPPKGSSSDVFGATSAPTMEQLRDRINERAGGNPYRDGGLKDPAFGPPGDPLTGWDARTGVRLIYRDIPIVTIQNSWTPTQVIGTLRSHMTGIFEDSAQMMDSMLGDDRVMATLGSRVSGLFGSEVVFKGSQMRRVKDSSAAKECLAAWQEWWPCLADSFALPESHVYAIFMGFAPAQILWDTTGDYWGPYLCPWHPRFTYYNWDIRKYIAITMDGQLPIFPGDGKWLLHVPYGSYRGWVRGAVRGVAEPWLIRHYAIRDWAGFSEIHGFPIRKAIVPASSEPAERNNFQAQVAALGSNTSILIPQGMDAKNGGTSYDLQLLEATDTAWQSFPGLRDHCDMAIVLALLFQNLTTEIKGGAFAAASAHMDIRQSGIKQDNAAWKQTIYKQLARPFAHLNFGDADLAPTTCWDVRARDDYAENAKQFQAFGTGIEVLRRGGMKFLSVDEVRKFARETLGMEQLPEFDIVDPVGSGAGSGGAGFGSMSVRASKSRNAKVRGKRRRA